MASPIKYAELYLYTTSNADCSAFRAYLDAQGIDFVNLHYIDEESKKATLSALSTWFDDPTAPGVKLPITSFPILVFEKVYWESEDGEEKYQKRDFALNQSNLPADFIRKAPKVS